MKLCSKCKFEKDESQFNFRNKTKGIYASQCKECKYSFEYNECACGKQKRRISENCQKCKNSKSLEDSNYTTLTIGDKIYSKHKYAKYSYIRYYARKLGLELGFNCCKHCGYDKHFEVCHIKSISSFTKDTLLTTVNSPDNIIPLCPNCHYEFDKGNIKF